LGEKNTVYEVVWYIPVFINTILCEDTGNYSDGHASSKPANEIIKFSAPVSSAACPCGSSKTTGVLFVSSSGQSKNWVSDAVV
jgi:hypothetical protein